MDFEDSIDLDSCVAPLEAGDGAGIDLRESRSDNYYLAKDARNNARTAERAAVMAEDPSGGDSYVHWKQVVDLCPGILRDESKDLEVAAWLLEGLVRLDGAQGLRTGVTLIRRLVDDFWDNLYPLPDEDGLETKVAPLTGLNGEGSEGALIAPIRNIEITGPGSHNGMFDAFNFWQAQKAMEIGKITDEDARKSRIDQSGLSPDALAAAVNKTPLDFFQALIANLEEAHAQYKALSDVLSTHCGHDAPPTSNILDILEELQRTIRFCAKDKFAAAEQQQQQEASTPVDSGDGEESITANATSGSRGPSITMGQINNRAEALRQLSEIARFFRATEPHTPLASGIERLVRWGNMPLDELIQELLPDAGARSMYQQLTGVDINNRPADAGSMMTDSYATDSYQPSEPSYVSEPDEPQESQGGGW